MNFSQRIGLEPATKPFQKDSMDSALRHSLWNAFELTLLPCMTQQARLGATSRQGLCAEFLVRLWAQFFKHRLDTLPANPMRAIEVLMAWFFEEERTPWNKIYEFLEFVADLGAPDLQSEVEEFVNACNIVLEREFSAYRFVGKTLSAITNDAEINAIVQAASMDTSLLRPVSTHISTALTLLSDRKKPDYRNSMKESISAVEALCKIIAKNDKATLGPALDAVTGKTGLHQKLQEGFKALYGYTSDTHGIRHALKDDEQPDAENATFMLITCSAFVHYLTGVHSQKVVAKAGIG